MPQVFVWTLEDVLLLALVGLFAVVVMFVYLQRWAAQKLCKHDGGVSETSACDAICRKCGKNLGFIDNHRPTENNKRREER